MVMKPPKTAQRILLRFLRTDLAEEVQGDLEEKFYTQIERKSPLRAKIDYWYQVINYLRPFAIGKSKSYYLNSYAMFRSYFKIGFRNLLRSKGYSLINIGGLAVGMAVAMLIGLWIYDELTFNSYHHNNYDRVAQVMQHQTFNGYKGSDNSLPRPLESALRTEFPNDFEFISMSSWNGDHILSYGDKKISKTGNFVQEDFSKISSMKIIEGVSKGLNDPTTILLSESTASAIFGKTAPINQSIRLDNKYDLKVVGVYEDFPHNSSMGELQFLASWEVHANSEDWIKNAITQWGNNSFQMFVTIAPNTTMEGVSEKIKNVKARHGKDEVQFKPEIYLHPMKDWHLRSEWKNGVQVGGRMQMVWLFGIIGTFVLLLACINFMNLSTARSEKRAKEVGIRMTIGSLRRQLVNQFLSESFLVVLLSFVLAMGVVVISLPWFNELADKKIAIAWSSLWFWVVSFTFIIMTSLLAGSYPALYLSSFQPVKVLKGTFKTGKLAAIPRQVMVVVQFTVSVTLIIGTIIVYRQIQYTKNRPIGYDRDRLIMIQMKSEDFYGKEEILKTELKNNGAIEEISQSSSPMTGIWSNNGGFDWQGKDPALQTDFATIWVSHDYGKTVSWRVTEGRDFSRDYATDTSAIILNKAAVKFMNIKDPIGMEVTWGGPNNKLHIIGVVEDMIMQSPYEPVKQAVYVITHRNFSWYNIKLNAAKSANESLALVEAAFKKQIPSAPFEYKFVDQEYAKKFDNEERIGKLSTVFAVLAIFISCLGIFGLASFVAEQRTKEIGIRKVLGASVGNLWRMLSKDFVVLVIISCGIAIPTAYYLLGNWLDKYEYHTEISWWVLVIAGSGTLLITLVTVSFQAIRAALMSPINSLKTE
jgi:putative ABC transport system permease protein